MLNPYANLKWTEARPYRFASHNHSIVKYAEDPSPHAAFWPDEILNFYRSGGFQIFSITEHTELIWPLNEWINEKDMDPSQGGSLIVKGNELNGQHDDDRDVSEFDFFETVGALRHHFCLYFSDVDREDGQGETTTDLLDKVKNENKGLVVLAHPGRYMNLYQREFYREYIEKYPQIIGIEVINQGNRYPNDVRLWDSLLMDYLPEKQIYGFASSDLHTGTGRSLNAHVVVYLNNLNEQNLKQAMIDGHFFVAQAYDNAFARLIPRIRRLYQKNGFMVVESLNANNIKWISNGGEIIEFGTRIRLNHPKINKYIRAEIRNKYGVIYTQAIAI